MKNCPDSAELLVVVGMPGAGKTTYINNLLEQGLLHGYCDDYQYGPTRTHKPALTADDERLFTALEQGLRWAVADTRYCDPRERTILGDELRSRFVDLTLNFVYFENKPQKCAHNAIIRQRGDALHQLNLIYYYTELYEIPPDAPVLRIFRS